MTYKNPAQTADIRSVAQSYQDRGFVPIPMTPRGKTPARKAWPQSTLDSPLDDFSPDSNIGIVLGEPSGGLVDIDFDCAEAKELAPYLLPPTGVAFGRAGDFPSHYIYRVADCGGLKQFAHEGEMLVEYRANGQNTVFPPSVYDDGTPREFFSDGEPAECSRDELIRHAGKIAAAVLLVRAIARRHAPYGCPHPAVFQQGNPVTHRSQTLVSCGGPTGLRTALSDEVDRYRFGFDHVDLLCFCSSASRQAFARRRPSPW